MGIPKNNCVLIVTSNGLFFPHYSYQSVGAFMSDLTFYVTGRKKNYDWRNLQFFFNEAAVDPETGLEYVQFEHGVFAGWKLIKFNDETQMRMFLFHTLQFPSTDATK